MVTDMKLLLAPIQVDTGLKANKRATDGENRFVSASLAENAMAAASSGLEAMAVTSSGRNNVGIACGYAADGLNVYTNTAKPCGYTGEPTADND